MRISKLLFFIFAFGISLGAYAEKPVPEHQTQTQQTDLKNSSENLIESRDWGVYYNFSYPDLILPGKTGFSIYKHFENLNTVFELGYLKSNFSVPFVVSDIGDLTDQRIFILNRRFSENSSYNWFWGLSYMSIKAKIGSELLASVSNNSIPNLDVIDIQSVGLDLGFGNRWHFSHHLSLGIDWFGISMPISSLKKEAPYLQAQASAEDKDKVDKLVNFVSYLPRIYILKLQLGLTF